MRGQAAILGHHSPFVIKHPYIESPDIYHRFNRNCHARNKPGSSPGGSKIRYLRRLMQLRAHSVPNIAADNGISVLLCIDLDRMRYVGYPVSDPGIFYALVKTLPCNFYKRLCLGRDGTCHKGCSAVPVVPLVYGSHIDRHNIAIMYLPLPRNTVNDFVVYRNTRARWKARIPLE